MAKRKNAEDENKMDEKSANPGDCMKHPLNLELISRTQLWPSFCYSETHAGAGVYKESKQKPSDPHIRQLRERVMWENLKVLKATIPPQLIAPASVNSPGKLFLDLLSSWWDLPENFSKYPGSARQVAEFLRTTERQNFEIRLTENHDKTCNRLKKAMAFEDKATVEQSSFLDEISWLLEKDNLLAVVDPFAICDSIDGLGRKNVGIEFGYIDLAIVKDFLKGIEKKANAIIHFWWPLAYQGNDATMKASVVSGNQQAKDLFKQWCEIAPDTRFYHAFHDGHNHKSSLLGLGGGASLVREVSELDWTSSWLSPYIKPLRE